MQSPLRLGLPGTFKLATPNLLGGKNNFLAHARCQRNGLSALTALPITSQLAESRSGSNVKARSKPVKHSCWSTVWKWQFQTLSNGAWRTAVRNYQTRSAAGAEPGIDLSARESSTKTSAPENKSEITVVDFSAEVLEEHNVASESIDSFIAENPRQESATCRWIFVNGHDIGVIRSLAQRNNLHRLAIEDVLDTHSRTKVDWYKGHLCAILTLQKLIELQHPTEDKAVAATNRPVRLRESWQQRYLGESKKQQVRHAGGHRSRLASRHSPAFRIEQVSIFLTADGTVITIFESMGKEVLRPVLERIRASGTILRSSDDASMLVHAVLDTIVDLSMPIAGAYHNAIRDLELEVLTNPKISQPRELYALRSDLALLDSVVKPIDGLVNTLRDHQYVSFLSNNPRALHHHGSNPTIHAPDKDNNLISPLAQAYLADVHDHVLVVSTSLAASVGSVENLTSLIFNTISARQNESIRQLTIVTIFFLPLSFLTGYFGMNFDPFPAVQNNSDTFFWLMATPVMFVTLFTLLRGARARQIARRLKRRWIRSRSSDRD